MNTNTTSLDSVIGQISSVIANNIDSIYELHYDTGIYRMLKASPVVAKAFGKTGKCSHFLTQVLTGRTSPSSADVYEGFYVKQDFMGKIYSRYVDIVSDQSVTKLYFLYLKADDHKAFALFYPLNDNLQGEGHKPTKQSALSQSYLYSMLVNLDKNECYDVYVSEISNPNQDRLKLTYSDWRTNLVSCIMDKYRPSFQENTDPEHVRAKLSQANRFSFSLQMHTLSGKTLWTQHTLLRIQDNKEDHLLFIYTVQDIDEQIRPLLNHVSMRGKEYPEDGLSGERTEMTASIFKTMQSLSSFSGLILSQIEIEIHDNYRQKLSLKQMAAKYYINAAYLGQLFIQKYNMTFHDYLNEVRMEKAAELLRTSNYSINQIAEMTGIPNSNYFHRLFKKKYNCTPLEYKYTYKVNLT